MEMQFWGAADVNICTCVQTEAELWNLEQASFAQSEIGFATYWSSNLDPNAIRATNREIARWLQTCVASRISPGPQRHSAVGLLATVYLIDCSTVCYTTRSR